MFAYPRMSIGAVLALLCTLPASTPAAEKSSLMTGRIVGGLPADDIPIPYIVSLMVYGMHNCGGSIINARTVITAAHCLANIRPALMQVRAGTKLRSAKDGVVMNVQAIHYHKDWTADTMDYDIGLVRLKKPLDYSSTIKPIRLPSPGQRFADGSLAMVAGWGYVHENGPASSVLRYARVPIVNQGTCNRLFDGAITDRMICAGYLKGGIDACRVDSGGPLVQNQVLIGIVSWGVGCAAPDAPGVYTRVTALLPWVENTLAENYKEGITDA